MCRAGAAGLVGCTVGGGFWCRIWAGGGRGRRDAVGVVCVRAVGVVFRVILVFVVTITRTVFIIILTITILIAVMNQIIALVSPVGPECEILTLD